MNFDCYVLRYANRYMSFPGDYSLDENVFVIVVHDSGFV